VAAAAARRSLRGAAPLNPLALTAGEPAGIGPDLCLTAAVTARDYPLVCIADRELLRARAVALGLRCQLQDWSSRAAVTRAAGTLCVLHEPLAVPCRPGLPETANAPQVLAAIRRAVDGCASGEFSAMVTGPVQKSIINDAGIAFTGHTEFIAGRLRAGAPVMMLVAGELRVALATTHLPLRAVSAAITVDGLQHTLRVLQRDLRRWWGLAAPRIAVCGLNPHAGEGGHLGDEEQRVIEPAIRAARAEGIAAEGPFPADTVFVPRQLAHVDAVLAMYHDQGLPVLKHAGFGHAVNITLGLPIIRTSVDHGTALELAASGKADAGSLLAALRLAAALAAHDSSRTTVRA
jgi:4-hydroxythreonine-4-phosphate dehydrogenase